MGTGEVPQHCQDTVLLIEGVVANLTGCFAEQMKNDHILFGHILLSVQDRHSLVSYTTIASPCHMHKDRHISYAKSHEPALLVPVDKDQHTWQLTYQIRTGISCVESLRLLVCQEHNCKLIGRVTYCHLPCVTWHTWSSLAGCANSHALSRHVAILT